jgi:signal transduction histidine kinase
VAAVPAVVVVPAAVAAVRGAGAAVVVIVVEVVAVIVAPVIADGRSDRRARRVARALVERPVVVGRSRTGGGRVVADGEPADGFCPQADLDRTLDALVENALHYGNGEVEVRSAPGTLDVLDRGPGFAPGELAAVFERFHRGRAGRSGPSGTGLGLPIARELARRWGGDVTLANRDGGGARARVTVPSFPGA